MRIAFLHGLESGPHGRKYQSLAARWPDVLAPDCEGVRDVETRVAIVSDALAGQGPLLLVGSSFGGLVAALLADKPGDLDIRGVVLCAPALHVPAADVIQRRAHSCVVIHGTEDDIVPVTASRAFAARLGCTLIEVTDGHRLASSGDVLLAEVAKMIAALKEEGGE